MEEINEISMKQSKGFIKHVFNLDEETKNELVNIIQYGLLCIIPIVILNKTIKRLIPEADENKGSLEIGLEVIGQMVILFIGIYFIHRVVTYFPTYSGIDYKELNIFNIIIAFLVIVLSLQTKLGEKIEILASRGLEMLGYKEEEIIEENVEIKVTRPISGMGPTPTHQVSRADMEEQLNLHDNIRSEMMGGQQQVQPQMQQQQPQMQQQQTNQGPNFDNMYQEPLAANEGFGGYSAF
jgi:hypothetical protein